MKTWLVCIVPTLLLAFAGCSSRAEAPRLQKIGQLESRGELPGNDIRLITMKSPVRKGDTVTLTIEGQPDVTYGITSSYMYGDRVQTAYESKAAGKNGRVTWNWIVDENTAPGIYPVTISGGGRTYITSYTVRR